MCRNTTINEVCDFLNVPRELLFATFDSKTVDKIVELWDDGYEIKVHGYGYELDKNKTSNLEPKPEPETYVDVVKERQRRMRMINGNV